MKTVREVTGYDKYLNSLIHSKEYSFKLKLKYLLELVERLYDYKDYAYHDPYEVEDLIHETLGTIYGLIDIHNLEE
jgi:hypothetical protein